MSGKTLAAVGVSAMQRKKYKLQHIFCAAKQAAAVYKTSQPKCSFTDKLVVGTNAHS